MAKRKRNNNVLQIITLKTKDRATRTPLGMGVTSCASGRLSSSCPTCDHRRVTLVVNPVISHECGNDQI
jgi:hypothetical protein